MKLSEIAARLDCEISGGGEIEITGVAGMEHAAPGELTFLANPKYAHKVKHTRAAAILLSEPERDVNGPAGLSPRRQFTQFRRRPLQKRDLDRLAHAATPCEALWPQGIEGWPIRPAPGKSRDF